MFRAALKTFLTLTSFIPVLLAQGTQNRPLPQTKKAGDTLKPPEQMNWCSGHCTMLQLDHGAPFDKPHYGSQAKGSMFTVEKWTPEEVLIQREDFGAFPGRATLKGKLSPDGNSIVDGTIEWTYHPRGGLGKAPFRAAWDKAAESVPSNDTELAKQTGKDPNDTGDGRGGDADLQRLLFSAVQVMVGQ